MTRHLAGFWCLHCERTWHWVWVDRHGLTECPDDHCDGGFGDLWRVEGEFKHGEAVDMASERFNVLRRAADPFSE